MNKALQKISDIEKETLPPPPERKIPGTNIPDRGIPEQGFPGSRKFDPFRPGMPDNPDPYFDKNPPAIDPLMEIPYFYRRSEWQI